MIPLLLCAPPDSVSALPDYADFPAPRNSSATAGSGFIGTSAVSFVDSFGNSLVSQEVNAIVERCCGSSCEIFDTIKYMPLNLSSISYSRVCGCLYVRVSVLGKAAPAFPLGTVVSASVSRASVFQKSPGDASISMVIGARDAYGNAVSLSSSLFSNVFPFSIVDGAGAVLSLNLTAKFPMVALTWVVIVQPFYLVHTSGNTTISFDVSRVAPQLVLLQAPASCVVTLRCGTSPIIQVLPTSLFDGVVSVTATLAIDESPVAVSYTATQLLSNGTIVLQDFTVSSAGDIVAVFAIDGCPSSCSRRPSCPCGFSISFYASSGAPQSIFVATRPAYLAPVAVGASLLGPLSLSFLDNLGNVVLPTDDVLSLPTAQSLLPIAPSNYPSLLVCGNATASLQSTAPPFISLSAASNPTQLVASAVVNGYAVQSLIQLSTTTHAPISQLFVSPCNVNITSSCIYLSWTLFSSGQQPAAFLVTFRSGSNSSGPSVYRFIVQVPFLRAAVNDTSIVQMTVSVCPTDSLLQTAAFCNGPSISSQFSLYSVILRATVILLSSSSAAISVAMSENSGPRLPQFFSVSVTGVADNVVLNSFVGSASSTMTFFGLQPQYSYRCFIRSMDDQGRSLPVSYQTTAFTVLTPPTSFSVTSFNSTTIIATWIHPAGSSAALMYSLTAFLDDDSSDTVISSVKIAAPITAQLQSASLGNLLSLKRHRILLSGFNVGFSNYSSAFAVAYIRPTFPAVCPTSVGIFMMPPFTPPFYFRVSWQAPSSFVSSDPVYIAGYSAEWIQATGTRTSLLNRSPSSTAVIPLPLSVNAAVSLRVGATVSVDGLLSDSPLCSFVVSVGTMPELSLRDSDGNLVNGTTNRVFPGQSRIILFSTFHADAGEVLSINSTGSSVLLTRCVAYCNTRSGISDDYAFMMSSLNALPYGTITGDCRWDHSRV